MKHTKKRWLGLAFAPALFALIGFASPAQAADYSGTCANINQFNGTGNVTINNTGACSLPNALTATGFIHIDSTGAITANSLTAGSDMRVTTTGGAITTQALTTNNGDLKITSSTNITTTGAISSRFAFQANANNGKISVSGAVTSNQSGNGGNILMVATGNIATGSISNSGASTLGGIEIHANTAANGSQFVIGGTTGANGINGTINASTVTGGGTNPTFINGGVFITNGNAASTAGIKVNSASSINVIASGSRSGIIALDARNGMITLPTGPLSSTGPGGQPAGQIILMAGTLKTVNNTVITASQTAAALSTNHGVIVAASSITVAGAGGLKINGDGNGITGSPSTAYAMVLPTGGVTVSSTAFTSNDVNNMLWTTSSFTPANTNAPVVVSGAGAFTLTANGDYARAAMYGYPITFSNAAVNLTSKGNIEHRVEVLYGGTHTGITGLTFNGTGAVTLDASGLASGNTGGTVRVFTDKASIASTVPTVNVFANAPSAGGNAGIIDFSTKALTLNTVTKVKVTGNGPTAGTGKGGNVTFFPGTIADLRLGTNAGNVQVLADGGSTGGDAGRLNVNPFPSPSNVTIDTVNAVSAKALAGNAKGGFVQLVANPDLSVNSTLTGATINVDGKGSGSAGEIHIFANGTLKLGSAVGSLLLSAKGDPAGTGDGGIIELGYITNLTQAGVLSVDGGAANGSNAKGGTINFHDINRLTANGTITANGKGTGFPGTVNLAQTLGGNNMNLAGANISASGDPTGDASGHDIDISSSAGIDMTGTVLHADASNTGNAFGGSVHITSAAQIDLTQPNTLITAKGADSGPGGVVVISSPSEFLVNTTIKVDSGAQVINPNTFGGSITLNSVTCQRRILGNTWPKFYWNCVNPASPQVGDDLIATTAAGLTSGERTILENIKATLYVQTDSGSFASYFGHVIGATAGFSFPEGPGETFDVTVFQKAQLPATGYSTLTAKQFTETAVHELGHAYDYGIGSPVGTAVISSSQPYINAINADLAYLNAAGGGSPCSANGTGPFNGVTDFTTNAPFCNGAVLNNPNNIYDGLTSNADIAASSTPTLGPGNLLGSQGSEIFAQVFSYHQYAKNPPVNYFITTADELFQKGYFQCTQALVAASIGTSFTPVLNYTCP